jgi:hypothetical protein
MSEDNILFRSTVSLRSNMIIPKDRIQHLMTYMAIINYANPRDMV